MEFKYSAVDNVKPTTTSSHSLSPATYLPDPSLQMEGGFSGLSSEAALRRALEKEQIRLEILRRMELEEEVRRELEIERELGISIPRQLNIQGLVSQWSNSTVMNPLAVGHIGASQPPSILPPTEINSSPQISEKEKVIVLARPDTKLFNAKRKAATLNVSETKPSALDLKKKQKQEWSCALCEIKATSESGLNSHLNGKKHKMKEARQNKMICKSYKKSEKIVNLKATETTGVSTTKLEVDVEKDQQCCIPLEVTNKTIVAKGVKESKQEEQLVEKMADDSVSSAMSTNEKMNKFEQNSGSPSTYSINKSS